LKSPPSKDSNKDGSVGALGTMGTHGNHGALSSQALPEAQEAKARHDAPELRVLSDGPPLIGDTGMSASAQPAPTVHLLMATYEGGDYLGEQLDSLAQQSYARWTLTVSDDGSQDDTLQIVDSFALKVTQAVRVIQGPRLGSTPNFVHLVNHVLWGDPEPSFSEFAALDTDLFGFVDQDDVWVPLKLSRAVAWHLHERDKDPRGLTAPLLYASAKQEVDAFLKPCRVPSERLARVGPRLGFGGALTQNVVSGNTMVMNAELIKIYQHIQANHAVWHDWTAYLVATGCGGLVHVDPEVSVLYRQHPRNVIGSQSGWGAQLRRLQQIPKGRYRGWLDANLAATEDINSYLTPASLSLRDHFKAIRSCGNPFRRIMLCRQSGLWRQSPLEQVAFMIGLGLGWV